MRILGFQKTTLLDYPHKIAATVFLGGCNFRCPFCQNALLVTNRQPVAELSQEKILTYLKNRAGLLEGVCITGGEPTIHADLPELIYEIKSLGYLVKLDTNGTNPSMIFSLIADHLIDYVAMDIKNSPSHYASTAGAALSLPDIQQSIDLLLQDKIPYEFRTTVVRELHTDKDFVQIGDWLHGASQYFLQDFRDSESLIVPGKFHSYERSTLEQFCEILKPHIQFVALRGID